MVGRGSGPDTTLGEGPGVLRARPVPTQAEASLPPGLSRLGLGGVRDGLVLLPVDHAPDEPLSLLMMLHGAGGDADGAVALVRDAAEAFGLLLLAPDSRAPTWDIIRGGYGPDVAFLDAALAHLFACRAVDPARLAVGGFSDGASYALSLAIGNGGLFTHALAFSPGFAAPARQTGQPRLFVSHGTQDGVLPIGQCSRKLVPTFRRAGYEVLYREFEGGHSVPPGIAREAFAWLAGDDKV